MTDYSQCRDALQSIVESDLLPYEVIVVKDGPINFDLEKVIDLFNCSIVFRIFNINQNQGSGFARNLGISYAKMPVIALMDADDLCRKNRFSLQYDCIVKDGYDVVGGLIEEFESAPGDLGLIRAVPENSENIIKKAKFSQPVNNVTIMFKKSAFDNVGGYHIGRFVEDFDLIYRMIVAGYKFYNIQSTLVDVRLGVNFSQRRSGLNYCIAEQKLLLRMYKHGFLNFYQFIINCFIRFIFRVLQNRLTSKLHILLMRRSKSKT